MILNIFVLMIVFIPFWTSLVYKHSTWITKVMVFIWCSLVAFVLFMIRDASISLEQYGYPIDWFPITLICSWFIFGQFIGLKAVLSELPRYNSLNSTND